MGDSMKNIRRVVLIIIFILIVLLLALPLFVEAKEVNLYVFYGEGCPHCRDLETYLDELSNDNNYKDKFKVVKYEIWHNIENKNLMNSVSSYLNANATGVPFYIIGDFYKVGFPNPASTDEKVIEAVNQRKEEIKSNIDKSYEAANSETPTYEDIVAEIANGTITVTTSKTTTSEQTESTTTSFTKTDNEKKNQALKNILTIAGAIVAVIAIFALGIWIIK